MASLPAEVSTRINRELATMLLKKAETAKSVSVSNLGGWQSDSHLPEWGGEPTDLILTALKELIAKVTIYKEDNTFKRGAIDWKINGWANINKNGNANKAHTHPGAYWSAVYYVQTEDDSEPETTPGGELELFDPRGVLPVLYCPLLRCGIQGYTTGGGSELHTPKAGECVLFPSWLSHSVKPHSGVKPRISLAFNFSI